MATKENVVQVTTPMQMQLTPEEADTLRERFRAELANVVSSRVEFESVVSETNIGPITPTPNKRRRTRKSGKKGARKPGTKKGARKPGTKKGARKPGTKKGARKSGAKKGARKTSKKK